MVLASRGRGRPEKTSQVESATRFLYNWSVDMFCLSLSVQKLFDIVENFGLKCPLGRPTNSRGVGGFRPLNVSTHQ
jgi:hypothetical protein